MADFKIFCESNVDPIGVGTRNPRFSWRLSQGADQVAYNLTVWDADGNTVFANAEETGRNNCTFEGRLESSSLYTWRVTLTLEDGTIITSPVGSFETALLDGLEGDYISYAKYEKRKSPYFLKQTDIAKEIASARAYICGLGYYELSINGKKVGDTSLCPGWTDYNKRVLYDTYDITDFLKSGRNAIGVQLGEGWFGHEHSFFMHIF